MTLFSRSRSRSRSRRLAGVATLLVAGLALTGCAAGSSATGPVSAAPRAALSSLPVLKDPKAYEGPSTATLTSDSITPVVTDPKPDLPVTVVSHDRGGDVPVTITSDSRIVSFDLSGSIAGTVVGVGLGSHLVGRDVATTFPGAKKLPLVTSPDGQSVNVEAILALKPTVVLTDGTVGPIDVIQQLRQAKIPVVFVTNTASFVGAASLARQVGSALGVPSAGEKLAARVTSQVQDDKAAIAKIAPKKAGDKLRIVFLYLRGDAGIYYLFGKGSGADALIDGLDAVDVATETGWNGMKPMTDEALITMDPDLILVMTDGLESVGGVSGLLQKKPAVALTSAGKHQRIVDMADGDVLSFGPRSPQILDALARAIYAPAAK